MKARSENTNVLQKGLTAQREPQVFAISCKLAEGWTELDASMAGKTASHQIYFSLNRPFALLTECLTNRWNADDRRT